MSDIQELASETDKRLSVHEAVCVQRHDSIQKRFDDGEKRMTKIEYLLYVVILAVLLGPGVAAGAGGAGFGGNTTLNSGGAGGAMYLSGANGTTTENEKGQPAITITNFSSSNVFFNTGIGGAGSTSVGNSSNIHGCALDGGGGGGSTPLNASAGTWGGSSTYGGSAGAAGGSITTGNVASDGGNGGTHLRRTSGGGGAGGTGATGVAGDAGDSTGAGGGGGGANTTGTGGAGGGGGGPGCGGGGGGGGTTTGGAGGAGFRGEARIWGIS